MNNKNQIINEYQYWAEIRDQFHVKFDYKESNKATRKLIVLNKKLKLNLQLAYSIIDELIGSENKSLKIWINELAYDLNYRTEECIKYLFEVSKEEKGLYALDVRMYLNDKKLIDKLV